MILLLTALLFHLVTPLAAQESERDGTLQLPDVTLLGEYTVYLRTPEPKLLGVPAAMGMSDRRFGYPRSIVTLTLSDPPAPGIYWLTIPPSAAAPPGVLPEPDTEAEPDTGAEPDQPPSYAVWQARVDYIPGTSAQSALIAARSSNVWDLSAHLSFGLADGWLTRELNSPTHLLFAVEARRRTQALQIDTAVRGGAFYPPESPPLYSIALNAELYGQEGRFRWREGTRLYGNSQAGGGTRRGGVEQDLQLSLVGSRYDLSLQASGILAGELPSLAAEEHGTFSLELGWLHPRSFVRLWAGTAALYYDASLRIYPSGGLQLYPTKSFSLVVRGAPFLHMPVKPDFYTALADSGLPQIEVEGGYSLVTELRLDPSASFGASLSFEWQKGRSYYFDAPEMVFGDNSRGTIIGDLIWQIRPGRPGIRVHLTGQVGLPFPLTNRSWQDPLSRYAGVAWTTDFHKLPVEFIIRGLIGDFADDGSLPFLFTDWEIISGLMTSVEGNWKIGKRSTVHTGVEMFLQENFRYRILIGYGIRG
ncbi:MAG: hypothetical protein V3T35_12000 [Spirochaetia bacterium]